MKDWINDFVDATEKVNSPALFRKWGAIFALGSALERKVHIITKQSKLFANLYVIFIAPPGVGKSEITWRVRELLDDIPDHYIAQSSLTKAALVDSLDAAKRVVSMPLPDEPLRYNALPIVSNELGVLLPSYDMEFMNFLTDLYDCKTYDENRRSKDVKIKIEKPMLSLLAATTPNYLTNMLPEGAWDQGFLSRTLLIYSGEIELGELFGDFDDVDPLKDLKKRLQDKALLSGQMTFTDEAKAIVSNWYRSRGAPAPEHPKLMHYNTRRVVHLLKLCMIVSVSESDDLVITEDNVRRALDLLTEAEFQMPRIFKAMASGGASKVIEEAWHYIYRKYNEAGQAPVSEAMVVRFLTGKVEPYQIEQLIALMIKSKLLVSMLGKHGTEYKPVKPDQ